MYHTSLPICLSVNIWVVSTFWLLWIVLLWMCFSPCLSSFLYIPEVELLDHTIILFLIFWGTIILFSTVAVPFYIPTSNAHVLSFSTSSPTLVIFRICFSFVLFQMIAILMGTTSVFHDIQSHRSLWTHVTRVFSFISSEGNSLVNQNVIRL